MRKVKNRLKSILQNGGIAYGAYVTIDSPVLIETIGGCGFDFVVIDVELIGPSPYDSKSLGNLIRACELYDMTSLIRVAENSASMILKALSLGAQGVVVAHCKTVHDAELMVKHSFYPPFGWRGIGPSRGLHDVVAELPEYVKQSNLETVVIPLIEDKEGVDNLGDILKIPEIDIIFLGPGDLSVSLGHPGELGHEEVLKYLDRARAICRARGKCTMELAGGREDAEKLVREGARALLLPDDVLVIYQSFRNRLEQLRAGASSASAHYKAQEKTR